MINPSEAAGLPVVPVGAKVHVIDIHPHDEFRYYARVVGVVVEDEDTPEGLVESEKYPGWYKGRINGQGQWSCEKPWFLAVRVRVIAEPA